jgi:hypothetical protein
MEKFTLVGKQNKILKNLKFFLILDLLTFFS